MVELYKLAHRLYIMQNCHTGTGKASGSAHTSKKGKSASNKTSFAQNRASTDSLGTSGFTAEEMAPYKTMHTQLEAKNKAVTATEHEGMSILTLPGYFC